MQQHEEKLGWGVYLTPNTAIQHHKRDATFPSCDSHTFPEQVAKEKADQAAKERKTKEKINVEKFFLAWYMKIERDSI